jgi:hypothetical protein
MYRSCVSDPQKWQTLIDHKVFDRIWGLLRRFDPPKIVESQLQQEVGTPPL